MNDLIFRLRQPPVFAQPAEGQRCKLVMAEAADTIEALCEASLPFADLKYQRGAYGIISKSVQDLDPVTVTVTKAQMIGLLAALSKAVQA